MLYGEYCVELGVGLYLTTRLEGVRVRGQRALSTRSSWSPPTGGMLSEGDGQEGSIVGKGGEIWEGGRERGDEVAVRGGKVEQGQKIK